MTEKSAEKKIESTFPEGPPYFARVDDAGFLGDKERIKVLIDLYEYYECLCKVQSAQYKNISKKSAKVENGKHFGWSGKWSYLRILNNLRYRLSVLTDGHHWWPSLTVRVSRPLCKHSE